ncbi:hypothetical protein R1flu_001958 [Riccia fluitans]|uniref:GTP diphosphokinase n=1 Tax=Riccia fluitans TaxID=41844 RepID=A0ABD1Y504_9MARC
MLMAAITLYSSSPPASIWTTQSSVSCSTSAAYDLDGLGRTSYNHSPAVRPLGGLSGLFSSVSSSSRILPSSLPPCSLGDGLEFSALSSCGATGLPRNSSQNDLTLHNVGSAWDVSGDGSRSGSVSIPTVSSCRLKERSPVSVLHGPSSRSSLHNSPIYSLIAWDSGATATTAGLPPLDPHIDRHHHGGRRRSSFTIDERRPLSRSVGFEVVGDSSAVVAYQARLASSDSSDLASASSWDDERGTIGGYFTQRMSDGFIRSTGEGLGRSINNLGGDFGCQQQELQETRRMLSKLAESPLPSSPPRNTSSGISSASELLAYAKARHRIFEDPLVVKAFHVAEEAHRNQVRRSGDLYLSHCVETALLLALTGADSTVVAAGLLHDTVDDSNLKQEQLRATFGSEIEYLVSGVSKLSTCSQLARDNDTVCNPVEADRLRTMFIAMVDVRVVLIKLADRLHNLRTLDALPADKQIRIAKETLEIFAPIANRLGIWSWKAEIEDTCFKYLKPQDHQELASKMAEGWQENVVLSTIQQLEQALRSEGVEFSDICGRPKNLYSIYNKMLRKGRSIDEIFDVRGVRLIVKDKESCYKALEAVHLLWESIPKKCKDYITKPKANGYQSLHTVIVGGDGHPLEVQIRTMEMHHQAEYGMAAHWRYKENNSKHSSFLLQKVEWARWVLTWHSEILDTKLRVSSMRADLRPPCPFPVHSDDCPYALGCSLPPASDSDPLFVILVEDDDMTVQELPSGSTAADLLVDIASDRDSLSVASHLRTMKWCRPKVNHQFVENYQQKLRMGDLVELSRQRELTPLMVPPKELEVTHGQSAAAKLYEEIALEFQREQLKRLYLDEVGCCEEARRSQQTTIEQQNATSIASFS